MTVGCSLQGTGVSTLGHSALHTEIIHNKYQTGVKLNTCVRGKKKVITKQGSTNARRLVVRATELCTAVPDICGVWNLAS
jgi:hypothetical protein